MRGKAALVVGLATGYVLGTRDGRERYEQIKTQATRLWQDPRVQQKKGQAQDFAKEKAPQVKAQVADTASTVAGKASDKVSSSPSGSQPGADAADLTAGPATPAAPTGPTGDLAAGGPGTGTGDRG